MFHASSYDWHSLRYLGGKINFVRYTIAGSWIPTNSEIRSTDKTGLKDIVISRLDPYCAYRHFPEDTAHVIYLGKRCPWFIEI
jgi:hypothetical protein